jgi:glycosyltransferase involved in cell wall biosynthesis
MPAIVRGKLNSSLARIAMSKFGERQIHAAGMDCWYIPLGVETQVMKPMDKKAAREKIKIPADAWVIGTVAMNKGLPSRKNFAEMLTAFAHCKKRHPDWFYWLQTERGEGLPDVVNLPELCRNLGLEEGKDFAFCNQYQNVIGFPPEYFADLYSALDVHCLVSAGEGFGIPTLEAQACGTPVIVGDWTASSELCLAGRMVDKKDSIPFYTGLASWQFIPRIGAIEDAMEEEYRNRTDTTQAVELVRAIYDADVIVQQHWIPTLAKIEAAVNKEWAK